MPIVITGMHRAGTSMVAHLLRRCGLFLGPDTVLMPATVENPNGFWEHLQIVEINEELLSLLGGGWDCLPPAPDDWHDTRFAYLRTRASRVLEEMSGYPTWGWKDPRTSLTIPFWRTVTDSMRVVVVVRNPLEVALSLRRRNGVSIALGMTLWQATYQQLLADTSPAERILTHYDAYFGNPVAEIERVLRYLELAPDQSVIASLAAETRSTNLRHHRFTARDLIEADVTEPVLRFYRLLCHEAAWADDGAEFLPSIPNGANDLPFDDTRIVPWERTVGTRLAAGIGYTNRASLELAMLRWDLSEHKRTAIRLQARIAELEGALIERDDRIVERDDRIRERDERMSRFARALQQRDTTIKQLTAERNELSREAEELRQALAAAAIDDPPPPLTTEDALTPPPTTMAAS